MLVEPNKVNNDRKYLPYLSGELSHIYNPFDTIIKNKYDQMITTKNSENIEYTIHSLNSVKFKINEEMLNYIIEEWNKENSVLFKGYNKLLEINKKDKNKTKLEKQSHNSIYWQYLNTINLANIYKGYDLYFPTFADFRGRIYTLSNYLSYQGNDLNRSLLLFSLTKKESEAQILNEEGFNYLKIYFTNLAGHSKLSWREKLNWFENNIINIIHNYENNNDEFNKFVTNLSEPFQFISIFLAIYSVLKNELDYNKIAVYNPILFDASCSGIQHLSALTREVEIAKKVNVISEANEPYDEKPGDFYSYAANLIQEKLNKTEELNNIKLNRSVIKKTVMTIPYNISLTGVGDQLKDHFKFITDLNGQYLIEIKPEHTKNNKTLFLLPKQFGLLTKIIFVTLTKELPSLNSLTNYLNNLVNVLLVLNKPIIWITPNGLTINLSTVKYDQIRTSSRLIPSSNPVTITLPTDKLNKVKIKRSFMPNLIHSLDAANIHLFIKKISNMPIYTIHDCFASLPNNMNILEILVKQAFIEIYFKDGNYLKTMHDHILKQIYSYTDVMRNSNGEEYIKVNGKDYVIPQIPNSFLDNKVMNEFIKGLQNSKNFIG